MADYTNLSQAVNQAVSSGFDTAFQRMDRQRKLQRVQSDLQNIMGALRPSEDRQVNKRLTAMTGAEQRGTVLEDLAASLQNVQSEQGLAIGTSLLEQAMQNRMKRRQPRDLDYYSKPIEIDIPISDGKTKRVTAASKQKAAQIFNRFPNAKYANEEVETPETFGTPQYLKDPEGKLKPFVEKQRYQKYSQKSGWLPAVGPENASTQTGYATFIDPNDPYNKEKIRTVRKGSTEAQQLIEDEGLVEVTPGQMGDILGVTPDYYANIEESVANRYEDGNKIARLNDVAASIAKTKGEQSIAPQNAVRLAEQFDREMDRVITEKGLILGRQNVGEAQKYIRKWKKHGVPNERIVQKLEEKGWKPSKILRVFGEPVRGKDEDQLQREVKMLQGGEALPTTDTQAEPQNQQDQTDKQQYESAEEVRQAWRDGKISMEKAGSILREQFGFQ